MSAAEVFPYHRGMAPMLWVLFALSLIELSAVHLLVATRWPAVGWPLTIVSAIGALGIVAFIRSLSRRPHRIEEGMLVLNLGSLRSVRVPLKDIAAMQATWEGTVDAPGALKLAALAYPNRCLLLATPLPKGQSRVFIRLDDPQAFDAALAARGVPAA